MLLNVKKKRNKRERNMVLLGMVEETIYYKYVGEQSQDTDIWEGPE